MGGGSSVECYSSGGGDGLKVTLIRSTPQTRANRQSILGALVSGG